MANFAVITKIIVHTKPSGLADTEFIDGGENSLAQAISAYLESVVNTVTIHSISISVDRGVAYACIVHNSP